MPIDKDSEERPVNLAILNDRLETEFGIPLGVDRIRGKTFGQIVDDVKRTICSRNSGP